MCRVEIIFPDDMKVTGDLETVDAQGLVQIPITSVSPNIATNSFFINGCLGGYT